MMVNVIGKNKETQEEEIFELRIDNDDIACLYKDRNGVAVSTRQGKIFRVTQTMEQLQQQQ